MKKGILITMVVTAMCLSCRNVQQSDETDKEDYSEILEGNGVYFWKSVFELNDYEKDFLHNHNIRQIYVKMFDVATDLDWNTGKTDVFPVATTRFITHKPDSVTIVPTVYITLEALKHSAGQEESLAVKILKRVMAMVSYNDLGPVKTIQLDCDWTAGTRESYFKLCNKARSMLKLRGIALSGTIRLHQLNEKSLPFDKSVLMLYNLGGVKEYDTRNSILDYVELKKYLPERINRENMDFAYPTFSWGVLFRNMKFVALLHRSDFSDSTLFHLQGKNKYMVIAPVSIEGHELRAGDEIRIENSDPSEILKTKNLVEKNTEHSHHNIIYHLDSTNLSNYTENEIRNIYSL